MLKCGMEFRWIVKYSTIINVSDVCSNRTALDLHLRGFSPYASFTANSPDGYLHHSTNQLLVWKAA
tara:strand:+ start:330 stop:527 length:198 start_codon:yes stop_codon:yes gene_type:complete